MKPYNNLTQRGKLCRLRNLAISGLTHYQLDDPGLAYHGFETNLLYRVRTASGERFMLRLAYPGWRTLEDLRSEALWLNALARDTDIPVPEVVPTRHGDLVLPVSSPMVPNVWPMTLMRFKIPKLFSGFQPIPAVVGHTGATGSWLFYCEALDLLLAGTVNQLSAGAVPFRYIPKMLKVMEAARV